MTSEGLITSENTWSTLLTKSRQFIKPVPSLVRYLLMSSIVSSSVKLRPRVPRQVRNQVKTRQISKIYQWKNRQVLKTVGSTYGGFTNSALAELVKIDEKLSNANVIPSDKSLNSLFNISFMTKGGSFSLVTALMAMGRCAHVLNVVTD